MGENVEKAESILGNLRLTKISQGAEAIIFVTESHPYSVEQSNSKAIVKYRPRKPYRYPVLDLQIIKQRTVSESKVLFRLFQSSVAGFNSQNKKKNSVPIDQTKPNYVIQHGGVNCPKLLGLDVTNGFIFMEYVNDVLPNNQSSSLKNYLWLLETRFAESLDEKLTVKNCDELVTARDIENEVVCLNSKVCDLLVLVGIEIANMHLLDTVHGDLTTSNLVLKKFDAQDTSLQPIYEPYLIDFGLAYQSNLIEDKAVDIYVLEKALESTHPLFSKQYLEWVLQGYEQGYTLCGARNNAAKQYRLKHREVYNRLEAVRLRGRKRSMIG